jgi:hypothetical protein
MDPDSDLDADPDPSIVIIDLKDANKKLPGNLKKKFSGILLFEGTFTSFFKRFFLLYLFNDRRIRIRIQSRIRIRIYTSD